jgi:hypothetical protein
MRPPSPLSLLFGLLITHAAAPAPLDESFYTLLENTLNVNIAAQISYFGEKAVWTVKKSETTISGRSVNIRLVGKNIVVLAQLTPYENPDKSMVLVAHGQVWISAPLENQIQYLSTMKSIPVNIGERVVFYPLGVNKLEKQPNDLYNIQLEIDIRQNRSNAPKNP